MAQQIPSQQQTQFGGVVTSGHPLHRPVGSASRCNNFRVMPGNWLRLRSGRQKRSINFNAIQRLHEVRLANGGGYVAHFWAIDKADGTCWWQNVYVNDFSYFGMYFEQIATGSGYVAGSFPAICNSRNRTILYNGLGIRNGTTSRPAFSQTFGDGAIRYCGLDAYCPSGPPTMTCTGTTSGTTTVNYSRSLYVGLYNTATGHFGNGVQITLNGKAAPILAFSPGIVAWKGNVTIANLGNLKVAYHGTQIVYDAQGAQTMYSTEQTELQYVFYSTTDGGNTPYLLIDASGNPITCPIASSSVALTLDSYICSTSQEMPRFNNPPRPMSDICYANGRVYGVPMPGGSGGGLDFRYPWNDHDFAAVTWSAAADDVSDTDFVGIPEESWPLLNVKFTPNGERPKKIAATADGTRVLVITQTGTFLLEETADGLHTWYTVSLTSGIWDARSFALTTYGMCWLDQRKQIVLLPHGTMQLKVLSGDYADLLKGATATTPAAYVLDPPNSVDRYQIWIGGGTSVCHDFLVGGQAYTTDGQQVTAAGTLLDVTLKPHHILCIGGYAYTQEGQADNNFAVPVSDQQSDNSYADFTGDYVTQWTNYGDSRERKEVTDWVVVGDGAVSAQLGHSPLSVSWFADLDPTERSVALQKAPQSDTDCSYQGKLSTGSRRWYKWRINIAGHHSDPAATYVPGTADGDRNPNEYGTIWENNLTVNPSGNR